MDFVCGREGSRMGVNTSRRDSIRRKGAEPVTGRAQHAKQWSMGAQFAGLVVRPKKRGGQSRRGRADGAVGAQCARIAPLTSRPVDFCNDWERRRHVKPTANYC
ncbi:hypothetical protein V3C99_016973 [Haemonchus contortus]